MGLKDIFINSSNETYNQNMELLEEYGLLNPVGNPIKTFMRFLNSKNLNINTDEITDDIINEFLTSKDSVDVELAKVDREKNTIFNQRKVWINILEDDTLIGTDLLLSHDGITIEKTNQKIPYSKINDIDISEGGWSKDKITIETETEDIAFEINEEKSTALMEILEDNIENSKRSEIDDLMELYDLLADGKITRKEFEIKKDLIYSDDAYCTECGERIDFDSKFCNHCGHPVRD